MPNSSWDRLFFFCMMTNVFVTDTGLISCRFCSKLKDLSVHNVVVDSLRPMKDGGGRRRTWIGTSA